MSGHRRHRWRRLVADGIVLRIECRVCHRTPSELLDQRLVKPAERAQLADPIAEAIAAVEGRRGP